MTTLVTGAGGFLGGRIVRRLLEMGQPVRGLDLSFPMQLPSGAETVVGSILDRADLAAACDGATRVIHAAAIANLWAPGRFDYDRVNVVGTSLTLAAARRARARFVYISSYTTLIARDTPTDAKLDEAVAHVPNSLLGPYPRSKRQAELVVEAAVGAGQWACTLLPTAPIGRGDIRLTPPTALIRDLSLGKLPALLPCRMNMVDAEAVADAAITAFDKGEVGGRYLLASEDVEISDFADAIASRVGIPAPRRRVPRGVALAAAHVEAWLSKVTRRPPTAPLTGVRLACRPVRFDITRAAETLGFAPRSLHVCLDEALDDLRERGVLPASQL